MPDEDAAPDEAPAGTPAPVTRTPEQWAREFFPTSERGRAHHDSWKHGAAQGLHGWDMHRHHAGAPMQLLREDYQAAIFAAETLVEVHDAGAELPIHTYVPHPAALSPHHARRS